MKKCGCCFFQTRHDLEDTLQLEGYQFEPVCYCPPRLCQSLVYGLALSSLSGFFTCNLFKNAVGFTFADDLPKVEEDGNLVFMSSAFCIYALVTITLYYLPSVLITFAGLRTYDACKSENTKQENIETFRYQDITQYQS